MYMNLLHCTRVDLIVFDGMHTYTINHFFMKHNCKRSHFIRVHACMQFDSLFWYSKTCDDIDFRLRLSILKFESIMERKKESNT